MSLSLGEKLRQAREERGFTIIEVSEQTRISPLYLESIENDDYKTLPGGIFNKGFVKSYAKFVGIDEQEALAEYSRLTSDSPDGTEPEMKVYRPQVLTDDRSSRSMVPTVIGAIVILGLMTGGILFLLDYLRKPSDGPVAVATPKPASNTSSENPSNSNSNVETPTTSGGPDMASLNVELKASQPVKITATVDSEPPKPVNISAGSSSAFTPKQSLTLNYNRWNAANLQMTINGKTIELPSQPLDPKDRDRIIFTISSSNIGEIFSSGKVSATVPSVAIDANANVNGTPAPGSTPLVQAPVAAAPRPAPPKQTPAANAAPAKTPPPKPAETPKPPTMTGKPAGNTNP